MTDRYDFIVIGGGPAGMMAAGRAGERGKKVILLEKKDHLGRKLLMCATGRCNVTNTALLDIFIKAYERGGHFLRTALETFDNEKLRSFLLSYGVETVVENKGRVFPKSQKADSVLKALETYMHDHQVTIQTNSQVLRLNIESNCVSGVETNHGNIVGRNVLIATGGLSYPVTGSTGDRLYISFCRRSYNFPNIPRYYRLRDSRNMGKILTGNPHEKCAYRSVSIGKKDRGTVW